METAKENKFSIPAFRSEQIKAYCCLFRPDQTAGSHIQVFKHQSQIKFNISNTLRLMPHFQDYLVQQQDNMAHHIPHQLTIYNILYLQVARLDTPYFCLCQVMQIHLAR
jgi:hypothetical protein